MLVKIPINNPLLRAYLPALFSINEAGHIVVDKRSLTGSVIISFLMVSQKRKEPAIMEYVDPLNIVTFDVSKYAIRRGSPRSSLRLSDISMINHVLKKEFNMRFSEHWISYLAAGFSVVDAVDAFIFENHIDEYYLGDVSNLQRRILRYRLDSLRQVRRRMRRRVEYRKTTHRKKNLL